MTQIQAVVSLSLSGSHGERSDCVKWSKVLEGDFLPATVDQGSGWSRGSVCFVSDSWLEQRRLRQHLWLTVRTLAHHKSLPGPHARARVSRSARDCISCFVITAQQRPFSCWVCKPFKWPPGPICMYLCLCSLKWYSSCLLLLQWIGPDLPPPLFFSSTIQRQPTSSSKSAN